MSNLTMLDGEWAGEPDLLEFEVFGFKCEAKRHPDLGHLCGYITVGADHPWHALTYDEVDVCVHGGLTFSGKGKFGFDCAHAGDVVPKMQALKGGHYLGETYKGMGFVVGELIKLANQAKEAGK